jgi:hypothetical protein
VRYFVEEGKELDRRREKKKFSCVYSLKDGAKLKAIRR